jgi:hypothetical protein
MSVIASLITFVGIEFDFEMVGVVLFMMALM